MTKWTFKDDALISWSGCKQNFTGIKIFEATDVTDSLKQWCDWYKIELIELFVKFFNSSWHINLHMHEEENLEYKAMKLF